MCGARYGVIKCLINLRLSGYALKKTFLHKSNAYVNSGENLLFPVCDDRILVIRKLKGAECDGDCGINL